MLLYEKETEMFRLDNFFEILERKKNNKNREGKCIKCGKCEEACPQKIEIVRELEKVVEVLLK